jgi:hypothetical protein
MSYELLMTKYIRQQCGRAFESVSGRNEYQGNFLQWGRGQIYLSATWPFFKTGITNLLQTSESVQFGNAIAVNLPLAISSTSCKQLNLCV